MMGRVSAFFLLVFSLGGNARAQTALEPVKIKVNRIVFNPGNQYAVYVPSFEFHMFFQQTTNFLRSSVTADYDYRRQDMGFGMSHAFYRYVVNPGISVEDNLYFRTVFNDSTGVWNRNQTITPFLVHQLNKHSVVGMEFKFERDSSPKLDDGSSIVRYQDRSMKAYYLFQDRDGQGDSWNHHVLYASFARSYKILHGDFNYLLLEFLNQYSTELNEYIRYKNIISYRGNLTPQSSPLFFIGGHSTMIGYEQDEFWGRRAMYMQNLFEIKPWPTLSFSVGRANFRRLSVLLELDAGKVNGAPEIDGYERQKTHLRAGFGLGIGFNTDLPYMPKTDIHFITASPSDDFSDLKFYAGFGGWIN